MIPCMKLTGGLKMEFQNKSKDKNWKQPGKTVGKKCVSKFLYLLWYVSYSQIHLLEGRKNQDVVSKGTGI